MEGGDGSGERETGRAFRVLAAGMAVLFAVGAAVQWNDPDPLLWIVAYGFSAGVALEAARGRVRLVPSAVLAIVFAAWFAALAPSLIGAPGAAFSSFTMRESAHETPREAAGLALLTVWHASLVVVARRRRRAAAADRADSPAADA